MQPITPNLVPAGTQVIDQSDVLINEIEKAFIND